MHHAAFQHRTHMAASLRACRHGCCKQRLLHSRHSRRSVAAAPKALLQDIAGLLSRTNGLSKSQQTRCDPEMDAWLAARGLPQQRVALADIPDAGRGLVATCHIKRGEQLLHVPSSLVLTPDKALAGSCLRLVLQGIDLPDWSALAVALVEIRECGSLAGGLEDWRPYANILPEAPGSVLEWSDDEVERLLSGSGLQHKACEIRNAAEKTWEELCPLIEEAQHTGVPNAGMFNKQSLHWALGVLLSRAIRLDSLGGVEAVVPWADFVNHGVDANCFLDWDASSESVVLQADQGYAPGDEVLLSYGAKCSGELLLSYGFCPPFNTNPNDAAHLLVGLDPSDPLLDLKTQLLHSYNMPSQCPWPMRIDGLPAGLLHFTAFCDAAPSVAEETAELAKWLFEEGEFPILDGHNTEALAMEGLARRCNKALKGYPTSMEGDKAAAAAVVGGGGFHQRKALCAGIRVKERQILARTEFVLRRQLAL